MVVSTVCRQCNQGIQIRDGAAINRTPRVKFSPKPKAEAATAPVAKTAPPISRLFPFQVKEETSGKSSPSLLQRYLHATPENRIVVCTECRREHSASVQAQASHCPACGAYVSLRNYEINEKWHRRIQTRGNVHIMKKGSVQGVMIQCHDLTVEGVFHGSVDATGEVIFHHSAKILGKISCQQVKIPPHCEMETQHPIITHQALVQGQLHGSIIATGGVTLDKKALVVGDITAGSIVIAPGAKHKGMIMIKQAPRA